MKINQKILVYLLLFIISIIVLILLLKNYLNEKFSLANDIVTNKKLLQNVITKGEKLKSRQNLMGLSNKDSTEIIKQYIDKHKGLFNKKSNIVVDNSDLSLETKKIIQLIKLNELKLILERINDIEDIKLSK